MRLHKSGSWAVVSLALAAPVAAQIPAWQQCANEGGRCTPGSFPAEVRYGEPWGDRWTAPRTVSAAIDCTNAVWGDPSPGTGKRCEWRAVSAPVVTAGVALRVSWTHATANTDGSPLTDRIGYRVERASVEAGPWASWATTTADATTASGTVPTGRSCIRVATLTPTAQSDPTAPLCVSKDAPSAAPLPPGGVSESLAEAAYVTGATGDMRAVYARTSAASRGAKIGDLRVGPVTQTEPPFNRMKCDARDSFTYGAIRYSRVTDSRAPVALRAGYVSGCVSVGLQ